MIAIDLLALRTFAVVCELRSLTDAARHLGTTQAAVSQRLKKLETQLRAHLVDRDLRPLAPTPAGQVLLEGACRIFAEVAQIEVALLDRNRLPLPELRLGITDSLSSALVPSLVNAVKDSVNQLAVRVDSSAALCKMLVQRELHSVISSDPLSERDDIERHELCREPMVLVRRAGEVPASDEPETLKRLAANQPFIRYSPISPLAQQIETHLRRLRLAPPRNLEFNASEGILEMVRHGLGWTITTPLCLVQSRVDLTQLSICKLPFGEMSRSIRRDELGALPCRLASISCGIISEKVLDGLRRQLPWLARMIKIPALDGSDRNCAQGVRSGVPV
jgi:DNA-binding transcriptional LysR family regulator